MDKGNKTQVYPQKSLDSPRLAVLPLTNISSEAKDEYFTDGMTEELIATLSKIASLRIIARTSVMKYKGAGKTIREIGRELSVGTVLEGSVRKAGNKIRITAQLIDSQSEERLWSQQYDRNLEDVFAIQSDIAPKIARSLKVQILRTEKLRIDRWSTSNTEAYSLYLKGRYFLNKRTFESSKEAIRDFEHSLERDPITRLPTVALQIHMQY